MRDPSSMLMRSAPERLVEVGEKCLALDQVRESLVVTQQPSCGMVMLQVREPVRRERFYLGEVLVTKCEVRLGAARGWAMVDGDNPHAALAAAICDAVSRTDSAELSSLRAGIRELCEETATRLLTEERDSWSQVVETRVQFEEFE